MNEPTFDADGYPTDETLEAIEAWRLGTPFDAEPLMDFIGAAWHYPHMWVKDKGFTDETWPRPVLRYEFSTGGWSGNESLVEALERNEIAQLLGAWSWRRGGHYEYRFPKEEK